MAFKRSKICRHYQPHLSFTKTLKLGHLGARMLENDSLTLHYLSEDFILLLSSSPTPPSSLSSFALLFLCYPPPFFFIPPPCASAQGCCGGLGEDKGKEAGCRNRALSSSLCRAVASGRRHSKWLQ